MNQNESYNIFPTFHFLYLSGVKYSYLFVCFIILKARIRFTVIVYMLNLYGKL